MTGFHGVPLPFSELLTGQPARTACIQASRYRVQYHGLEVGGSVAHFIAGTAGKTSSFPLRLLLTIPPGGELIPTIALPMLKKRHKRPLLSAPIGR
jgi:hypothetical protein